jgi:hypothetical protein
MQSHDVDKYMKLGFTNWSSWEEGPVRDLFFPYEVVADYEGVPTPIRFGAFIGWFENIRWWIDLADSLSKGALRRLDLLGLEHQGGGHNCIPWNCTVRPVAIHNDYLAFAADLCRDNYHAYGGWMNFSQPDHGQIVARYLTRLEDVGLTGACVAEIQGGLMESVYPIDGSDKNLQAFLADPAKVLNELRPMLNRPVARASTKIFIIADNSD